MSRPRDAGVGDDPPFCDREVRRKGVFLFTVPSSLAMKWCEPLSATPESARTQHGAVRVHCVRIGESAGGKSAKTAGWPAWTCRREATEQRAQPRANLVCG